MQARAAATGQSNSTTSGSKSWLTRCLKAPFRALLRARNLYVSSLSKCAGDGTATGRGAAIMPRARSKNAFRQSAHFATSDDDLRELVRASSQGRKPHKTVSTVPTSGSVAAVIERIDEDSPYDVDSNKMKTA
ncbi:hypothetical protein HPP92_023763 [Vanilla planifolia]|uniref:Uncharacterized protein n=1 Tax=Vanilla planifolia TaxID=51239 RepID=A0A835PLM6_VANPL|nr:hypothetical protein HPP92_023763 [Vanilla planifolia]